MQGWAMEPDAIAQPARPLGGANLTKRELGSRATTETNRDSNHHDLRRLLLQSITNYDDCYDEL